MEASQQPELQQKPSTSKVVVKVLDIVSFLVLFGIPFLIVGIFLLFYQDAFTFEWWATLLFFIIIVFFMFYLMVYTFKHKSYFYTPYTGKQKKRFKLSSYFAGLIAILLAIFGVILLTTDFEYQYFTPTGTFILSGIFALGAIFGFIYGKKKQS